MVRRSLFDTLRMLRREGIEVDARMVGSDILVSMAFPIRAGTPWTRKYARTELPRAAGELATAAIMLYPTSALAKVAEVLSAAFAATKPRV